MGAAEKIVQDALKQMDEEKRKLVLVWAKQAKEIITRKDISKREKLVALKKLESKSAVVAFIHWTSMALKQHLWYARSWPARGALIGIAASMAVGGSQSAGIAAFGGAIGINWFLLTSAGRALLATIISELGSKK